MIIIKIQNVKSGFYYTVFSYCISMLYGDVLSFLEVYMHVYVYLVVEWFNDNLMV